MHDSLTKFAWALVCLLGLLHSRAEAQGREQNLAQPIAEGLRVFSAGHSCHWFVPDWLRPMAKDAKIKGHFHDGQAIGYSRVITHWNVPDEKNKLKQALKAGRVDVLTLAPIYLPDEGIEKIAALALEHNPKIRITLQQGWLPFDLYDPTFTKKFKEVDRDALSAEELRRRHAAYFESLDQHVRELNKKFAKQVLFVVPAGQATLALREKIRLGKAPGLKSQGDLFHDSLGHTKPPLAALTSYCHFAVIYRRSSVGLPVPALLKSADQPDGNAEMNRLLQEVAWDTVRQHPLSGLKVEN